MAVTSLTVFDIRDAAMQPLLERQARRATSPKNLADQCEIVFVSLPTLAAFRAVAFGGDGLIEGSAMKLLVNTCTVGVPFVKEIEQAMAARGVTDGRLPDLRRAARRARGHLVRHGLRRSGGGGTGAADDFVMGPHADRGR